MTPNRPREGAGFFIVSPTLDRVLVLEAGDYLDVPKGPRERNETPLQAALREIWNRSGIKLTESDMLTQDHYKVGNVTMFLAMSSKKPANSRGRNEAMYVPWRTLEENCDELLVPAIEWAKEKSFG
jgi:8-oxo-dGTP pyrophosphatase MutT (NUDIX family)